MSDNTLLDLQRTIAEDIHFFHTLWGFYCPATNTKTMYPIMFLGNNIHTNELVETPPYCPFCGGAIGAFVEDPHIPHMFKVDMVSVKKVKKPDPVKKPAPTQNPAPARKSNQPSKPVDKEGKFILYLTTTITFGKYKGEIVADLVETEPDYLLWVEDNVDWVALSDEVKMALSNSPDPEFPF